MTALKTFAFTVITAAILTACGESKQSNSAPNAASQPAAAASAAHASPAQSDTVTVKIASGEEITLKGEYAKIINAFPAVDAMLTQPLTISDKKSPTGKADLEKVGKFVSGAEAQALQKATMDVQRLAQHGAAKNEVPAELPAAMKQLSEKMTQFNQAAQNLGIQDEEIKAIVARLALSSDIASRVLVLAVENADTMKVDTKNKEAVDFAKVYREKTAEMQKAMLENQRTIAQASMELEKKYGR